MKQRIHDSFSSRVRWTPLIFAPVFLTLVGLGIWQLDRLSWKTQLISEIETRLSNSPVALSKCISNVNRSFYSCDYRHIKVKGHLWSDNIFTLLAKTYRKQAGAHILVPLMLENNKAVLINLGWVPQKFPVRELSFNEEVIISGIARIPNNQGWFIPNNDPLRNQWYWIDLAEMSRIVGVELSPVIIEAVMGPDPTSLPIGGQTRIRLPNDHLQYAVTWFALAFFLLVGFCLYYRQYAKIARSNNK